MKSPPENKTPPPVTEQNPTCVRSAGIDHIDLNAPVHFFNPGEDQLTPLCHWVTHKVNQGIPAHRLRIFLPSQRACRTFMALYLAHAGKSGQHNDPETTAVLLPNLFSMGDFTALQEALPPLYQQKLATPVPSALRRIILARLIAAQKKDQGMPFGIAFKVAKDLGTLLDQLAHQDIPLTTLSDTPPAYFQDHWSLVMTFLEILAETWPLILEEMAYVDQGVYQRQVMIAFGEALAAGDLKGPIMVAGSTGSQPLTRILMAQVKDYDHGTLWLYNSGQQTTPPVEHPGAFPHETLTALGLTGRAELNGLTACNTFTRPAVAKKSLGDVLFNLTGIQAADKPSLRRALTKVRLFETTDVGDEARLIATLTADLLSRDDRNIMIVCPDDFLMRRIRFALESQGILPDYSLGTPLSQTTVGALFLTLFTALTDQTAWTALLTLVSHPLTRGVGTDKSRVTCSAALDLLLKKPFTQRPCTFQDLSGDAPFDLVQEILSQMPTFVRTEQNIADLLAVHKKGFYTLIGGEDTPSKSPDIAQEFSQLQDMLTQLITLASLIPPLTTGQYYAFLTHYMDSIHVRPGQDQHPCLLMLDTREARLLPKDIVIMAGLNEGIWPRPQPASPWLPVGLAKQMGLPTRDALISLMGHDFLSHLQTETVFLTFSKRRDGLPAAPSPFIHRLRTVATLCDTSLEATLSYPPERGIAGTFTLPETSPILPTRLSLTALEALAKKYLSLDDLLYGDTRIEGYLMDPSAQEKGTLLHRFLAESALLFLETWSHPARTTAILHQALDHFLTQFPTHPEIQGLWRHQWRAAIKWLCYQHAEMPKPITIFAELPGALSLVCAQHPFQIRGRFDRVDLMEDGTYHLWDYKTGQVPAMRDILDHKALQLTFGAHMIQQGAFPGLAPETGPLKVRKQVTQIGYLGLSGKHQGGDIMTLDAPLPDLMRDVAVAVNELLTTLVSHYQALTSPPEKPR